MRCSTNTLPPIGDTHKNRKHMHSFDDTYLLEPVRDWLFGQRQNKHHQNK